VITEVRQGSPGDKAGLQAGDVIIEVDRKPVTSADDAAKLLAQPKSHLLRVTNARGTRFVTLTR
jgi:serine protease Do